MKPRQIQEIFEGLFNNNSPNISQTTTTIDKDIVLTQIISLVGTNTQSQGLD